MRTLDKGSRGYIVDLLYDQFKDSLEKHFLEFEIISAEYDNPMVVRTKDGQLYDIRVSARKP